MDDTLRLIFGNLTKKPPDMMSHTPSIDGAATLSALARTCQTFSDLALGLLWRQLPSIYHLVRCLPRDAYVIDRRKGHEDILVSKTRSLLSADSNPITETDKAYIRRRPYPHTLLWSQSERSWGRRAPPDDAPEGSFQGLPGSSSLLQEFSGSRQRQRINHHFVVTHIPSRLREHHHGASTATYLLQFHVTRSSRCNHHPHPMEIPFLSRHRAQSSRLTHLHHL